MNNCLVCGKSLIKRSRKYCSNTCEAAWKYNKYIAEWKLGKVSGSRGISAKNISGHIKRYLEAKYGNKCIICGWSEVNIYTRRVPLEIDHINGDADDNHEENLRLICPNCHALSGNFRNLNKGKGRKWRKSKYIKNVL
jgi:hypothetical protein